MMTDRTQWTRRAPSVECPVCKRMSWCTVSTDGRLARCMRVQSDRQATSIKGEPAWVHEIIAGAMAAPPLPPMKQVDKLPQHVVEGIARQAFTHYRADAARRNLSKTLGLSLPSIEAMRVGWGVDEGTGREWTSWPCRDWSGKIIGISRRYSDGSKRSMRATRTGLYFPMAKQLVTDPVLVIEGATDAAAAMMMGWFAIGRFSNTGGADLISRMGYRNLVVVGERDCEPGRRGTIGYCEKECKGCLRCYPGYFGAQLVASQLRCRMIMPPEGCKDLRQVVVKHRVHEFLDLLAGTHNG